MINIINAPDRYYVDDKTWWMVFNQSNSTIIELPNLCSGNIYSLFTLVLADTEEELKSYAVNNSLIFPPDPFGPDQSFGTEQPFEE